LPERNAPGKKKKEGLGGRHRIQRNGELPLTDGERRVEETYTPRGNGRTGATAPIDVLFYRTGAEEKTDKKSN